MLIVILFFYPVHPVNPVYYWLDRIYKITWMQPSSPPLFWIVTLFADSHTSQDPARITLIWFFMTINLTQLIVLLLRSGGESGAIANC